MTNEVWAIDYDAARLVVDTVPAKHNDGIPVITLPNH